MYTSILEIIKTIECRVPEYREEISQIVQRVQDKRAGVVLSLDDHIRTMVFALLSNNRPWKGIADNVDRLEDIFCNFSADRLKQVDPNQLIDSVRAIKCGNRMIARQMQTLHSNIATLQRIATQEGSIDGYYDSVDKYTLISELSSGRYKLQCMGMPLVCEYLKGVGVDVVKPDVHVCRIIGRLGYTQCCPATVQETLKVCSDISSALDITQIELDTTLWQYCVGDMAGVCSAQPNCGQCGVAHCPSRIGII